MERLISPGDLAPDFSLPAVPGPVSLAELRGRGVVVVIFYTEDATPLCTRELAPFVSDHAELAALGAEVVAISSDGPASHLEFARKLAIPFPLATDADLAVARSFGVADDEAGRANRAVFVVGRDGRLLHVNRDYNPGSAADYENVIAALGEAQID
jgi:thioredoxin-dependent peroxiredoxin